MLPNFNLNHTSKFVWEGIFLGAGAAAILLSKDATAKKRQSADVLHIAVQDRLRTIMTFIYCMSFGTLQEKQTIVDFMTRMHSQVSGNLAEGGGQGQEVQRPRSAPADVSGCHALRHDHRRLPAHLGQDLGRGGDGQHLLRVPHDHLRPASAQGVVRQPRRLLGVLGREDGHHRGHLAR
ncbi:hypothetical protein F4823DRAFT_594401 [Ustulina deusta]|nr:hypothetical protein F4823DRAFT_594401 [Ustulina deusta]